jgi:hypothetical protein
MQSFACLIGKADLACQNKGLGALWNFLDRNVLEFRVPVCGKRFRGVPHLGF